MDLEVIHQKENIGKWKLEMNGELEEQLNIWQINYEHAGGRGENVEITVEELGGANGGKED